MSERAHRERFRRPLAPDYSRIGVWRKSGVDQIRALTGQYSYRCFPVPVWCGRFTCRVNVGFIPILGLDWRYMPRCVGNLNNQG